MRILAQREIEKAIRQKTGPGSQHLDSRFRKYRNLMDGLEGLKRIDEQSLDGETRVKQLYLLFEGCKAASRIDGIGGLTAYMADKSEICKMAEDEILHEADVEKIKRSVWKFTIENIRTLHPSGENIEKYLENVTEAAVELLLLRRDLSHAILAARALDMENPSQVMNMLGRSELLDMTQYIIGGTEWRQCVNRLKVCEQHIIVAGFIGALDPENKDAIIGEMYPPEPIPEVEKKVESKGTESIVRQPEPLEYSRPAKKKKKKKNGNGKKPEIRYEVDFSEDAQREIRYHLLDPREVGNAIIYSFNLAGSAKAVGRAHFSKDKFENNVRRALPENLKRFISFLNSYDLIIYHKGSTKDDVSFNPKPDNEMGEQIAKSIIAYMKEYSG